MVRQGIKPAAALSLPLEALKLFKGKGAKAKLQAMICKGETIKIGGRVPFAKKNQGGARRKKNPRESPKERQRRLGAWRRQEEQMEGFRRVREPAGAGSEKQAWARLLALGVVKVPAGCPKCGGT